MGREKEDERKKVRSNTNTITYDENETREKDDKRKRARSNTSTTTYHENEKVDEKVACTQRTSNATQFRQRSRM